MTFHKQRYSNLPWLCNCNVRLDNIDCTMDLIWYVMIWYGMIRYDMILYDTIWYDMIYFLTAMGLTPGDSSTVHIYTQHNRHKQYIEQHIYTQTIHRQHNWHKHYIEQHNRYKQYIEQHNNDLWPDTQKRGTEGIRYVTESQSFSEKLKAVKLK